MVAQRSDHYVCPEARSILPHAPAFVLEATNTRRFAKLKLGEPLCDAFGGIKNRKVLADYFVRGVALEALRSRVPAEDVTIGIEREDRVIVDAFDKQSM